MDYEKHMFNKEQKKAYDTFTKNALIDIVIRKNEQLNEWASQRAKEKRCNCNIPDVSTSIQKECRKPEKYNCVKLYGGCCANLNCEYWC